MAHDPLSGSLACIALSGLILAGGAGRRMGGNKALRFLGGRPLLAWAIERLGPQVSEILLSANQAAPYADFGIRVVADEIEAAGPLSGVAAGLRIASHPWLMTVPCDAPFFPMNLAQALYEGAYAARADIAVARTPDGRQPVFSLLHRSVAPVLKRYLESGGRKADGWYAGLRVVDVDFHDARAFLNINTREDLAAAESRLVPGAEKAA